MSRTVKKSKESPSKRLRNVFYRLWEKDNEGHEDFEPYYEIKMDKLVDHYKKILEKICT